MVERKQLTLQTILSFNYKKTNSLTLLYVECTHDWLLTRFLSKTCLLTCHRKC